MPYKPKYCCQCGEKIERISWSLRTSRRFCELCETEFGVHDKIPWGVALGGILLGLFGFGSYLRMPETPNVAPNQLITRNVQNATKSEVNRSNLADGNLQTRNQTQTNNSRQLTNETVKTQNLTTQKPVIASNSTQEVSYFCGAATKKGTPCSRRVKGVGRCWQHEGESALLPQEKLIVKK